MAAVALIATCAAAGGPARVESIEVLAGEADAVVVGDLVVGDPESPFRAWPVIRVREVIKLGPLAMTPKFLAYPGVDWGLPPGVRRPAVGPPREPRYSGPLVRRYVHEHTPLLLFLTVREFDRYELRGGLVGFTNGSAIPLDRTADSRGYAASGRVLRGAEELLPAVRSAAGRSYGPRRILLPVDVAPGFADRFDPQTRSAVEAPLEAWWEFGAGEWLASDDPERRAFAIERLIDVPPPAARMRELLGPVLVDPFAKTAPNFLGQSTVFPIRHRAYHALRMSGVEVTPPVTETPSLHWRVGRVVLGGVVLVVAFAAVVRYRRRHWPRRIRAPLRRRVAWVAVFAWYCATATCILIWVVTRNGSIGVVVNTGGGTLAGVRSGAGALSVAVTTDWPRRISSVDVTTSDEEWRWRAVDNYGGASVVEWRRFTIRQANFASWIGRLPPPRVFTAVTVPWLYACTPMLAGVVAHGVVRLIAARRARRWRRTIAGGLCTGCGYDLRASAERCPECGLAIPVANDWIALLRE